MVRHRNEFTKPDDQDPAAASPGTDPSTVPGPVDPVLPEQPAEGVDRLAAPPEEALAEPPDAPDVPEESSAPPWREKPWLTLLLAAGVVAALAFTGGVLVEKHHLRHSGKPAAPASAAALDGTGRSGTAGVSGSGSGPATA